MFILGGEDKSKYLGQMFSYNFVSLAFQPCPPMIEQKVNFGAIYFKDCVFVVGGWKQFFTKRCQLYKVNSGTKGGVWYEMPHLASEREGITLCIVQDKYIYAFGNVTTRGRRFKAVGSGGNGSTSTSIVGGDQAQNLTKHTSTYPTSTEKYMEYNFERLDIEKLFQVLNTCGQCDNQTCKSQPSPVQWETLTVTSTFNIAKMSNEKIPSFKNMGCFNHYKNKNQVIIFGGVVQGTQAMQRSFMIDLEK